MLQCFCQVTTMKEQDKNKNSTTKQKDAPQTGSSKLFVCTSAIIAIIAVYFGAVVLTERNDALSAWYDFIAPQYDFIIGSVDVIEVTPKTDFANAIAEVGLPVIIRNSFVKNWAAYKLWDPEYIAKNVKLFKNIQYHTNRTFYYFKGIRPMSTLPGVVEHYKPTTFRHLNLTGEEFFSKIKKPPFKEFYYFTSEIDDIGDIKHDLYPIEPLIVKHPGYNPKESYKHRWTGVWIGPSGATTHNHYDIYENYFVQLRGRKRFILFPPDYYPNLYLYPFLHPGGQQSQVIFDDPESLKKFPKFKDAKAVEAILEPGDVLYLPPLWFHHVTALDMSVSVTVWSRPPETVNMWQAERTPFPVSKNASAEERALVLRIYMDLVLEKILGPDAAKPFVEALLEQRFQNIIDEIPSLLATDKSYCKSALGYNEKAVAAVKEAAAELLEELTGLFNSVKQVPVREIWLGNWCEMLALTATDAEHFIAFLSDYVRC